MIRKKERSERLLKANEKCIVIVPTGWGNGRNISHMIKEHMLFFILF